MAYRVLQDMVQTSYLFVFGVFRATLFTKVQVQGFYDYQVDFEVCHLKFICSEKATKFCEIFTLLLSFAVPVISEYMNFTQTKGCKFRQKSKKNMNAELELCQGHFEVTYL